MRNKPATSNHAPSAQMVAMNEALMLGALRQHQLTEAAEDLNARLRLENAERKRSEETVRVSETRYRRLFEAAHDGIVLIDPATSEITDANPFMTRLLGYPHDQFVGKQLFEIGLLKDETASREMVETLKQNREVRYEDLPLKSQDGQHVEVEVVANLYQESDRQVIQCNIRDITARKKAEAAQLSLDVLTASNRHLEKEIIRRQAVEASLHQTQQEQIRLLDQSRAQQEQLRDLSRRILQAQEEERKRISRELHDVISQNLIGINVHMSSLATEDLALLEALQEKIAGTQRLVEETVSMVHQFALDLRPSALDDLGLIPALRAFMEKFMKDTGIRSTLTAFAGIEQCVDDVRTVLFRIAQEALTNAGRHSGAGKVSVSIKTVKGLIRMEITDDGEGFDLAATSRGGKSKRLGLLGMKERIEMVGGTFQLKSVPGRGTTVRVELKKPSIKSP